MKSQKTILAYAFSTFTFCFPVFSQEPNFCTNPVKAICIDQKKQIELNNNNLKNLKNEIASEAQKNAKLKISKLVKPKGNSIKLEKYEEKVEDILYQETLKSAFIKVKPYETILRNPKYISKYKILMKQAVDESNLDESTRSTYKRVIDSTTIATWEEFIKKEPSENMCGADGMLVNAFSSEVEEKNYIIICPGMLVSLGKMDKDQDNFSSLINALSHEMGHHLIFSGDYLEPYEPFLNCLSDNYAERIKREEYDIQVCNVFYKGDEKICNLSVLIEPRERELISDQWATKVLAVYAKSNQNSLTQTEALLNNNLKANCGYKDEETHVSTEFRIEVFFRLNPDISNLLSCNNSKIEKPFCTF